MKRAGDEVGGYVVARRLGSGGMGTVYEAIDAEDRHVALKLLHPHIGADPVARDRLRREVETLHRVRHAGVARVLDAEADSEEAFVVTELIHGPTLDERVREQGPLEAGALADLARGLSGALAAIHAADVVHRDVKPANVMLTADGPVLIDFGISQIFDADRYTQAGLVTGTPGYLDPLVAAGAPPGPEGDWWSWAAVLVFAATGRQPFGGGPIPAVLGRVAAGEVAVADLPSGIARALTAALKPSGTRLSPPDLLAVLEGDPAGLAALDALDGAAPADRPGPGAEPPGDVATAYVPAPTAAAGTTPMATSRAQAAPAQGPSTQVQPTRAEQGRAQATGVEPTRVQRNSWRPPPPPPPPPTTPGTPPPAAPPTGQRPPYRPPASAPSAPSVPVRGMTAPYGTAAGYPAAMPYPPAASGTAPRTAPAPGAPGWAPGGAMAYGQPGYGQPGAGLPPGVAYGMPGGAAPGYEAPPPGRHLFMIVLWLLITSLAASWPGGVLVVVTLAMLLCGAVASAARVTRARRRRRGPRTSDAAVRWLLSPWYALHAVSVGLLALLVGALAGATTWFLWWTILTGEPIGQAVGGGTVEGGVTAGSVALAVAAAWLAPTSGLLREGGREVLADVLPGRRRRAVVMLVVLALALAFAVAAAVGVTAPVWAPLPSPIP